MNLMGCGMILYSVVEPRQTKRHLQAGPVGTFRSSAAPPSQGASPIRKVSLRDGLALHQERYTEVFSLVYLECLWWGANSKMTSHSSEKYISSCCMFTVFMMPWNTQTKKCMTWKKNTKIGSWSAEIEQDKLIKWKLSSTEISRSFVWD